MLGVLGECTLCHAEVYAMRMRLPPERPRRDCGSVLVLLCLLLPRDSGRERPLRALVVLFL